MLLFLSTALAIYIALHAVVFWGILPLLRKGGRVLTVAAAAWMAAMVAGPVLVRVLEAAGQEEIARALALLTFTWMGFAFLAFSMFFVLGVAELLGWLLGRCLSRRDWRTAHGPRLAGLLLLAVLAVGLYGMYEAGQVRVERLAITTQKPLSGPLRIVQVSDLHLGLLRRTESLAPLIAQISALNPDLLVVTGDMVDAQINHLDGLSDLWRQLEPPLGKYAVTGNHELYAGLAESLAFHQDSGFTVLRNQAVTLGGFLRLVGVDDEQIRNNWPDEVSLLHAQPAGIFTVFLKHRPLVPPGTEGLYDLQLSGHAHRGQIFPFSLLTALAFPLQDGLHHLPGGGLLYTSRGTGTWGPPMRVASPPEITVIDVSGAF